MVYPHKIESKDDLYLLSELASQEEFPIYISAGSATVDAKSLLALFTMVGKEINLVAPDHVDSDKFSQFINKLK